MSEKGKTMKVIIDLDQLPENLEPGKYNVKATNAYDDNNGNLVIVLEYVDER